MSYLMLFDKGSNRWVKVSEGEFKDETKMQEMIKDNPELIPISDLGDDVPPMMVVGRETSLPNGSVDLNCVDENGLVSLVECKLAKNPKVKRKVIAQIISYAAYLQGYSYFDFEEKVARHYFQSRFCRDERLKDSDSI